MPPELLLYQAKQERLGRLKACFTSRKLIGFHFHISYQIKESIMPNVTEVRPKIWDNVIDLYDDGDYSAIWGCREQATWRSLGVRWNGSGDYPGYPNQGRNPVWYSEPEFLEHSILLTLLDKVNKSNLPRREEFIGNILTALKEHNDYTAERRP